MKILIIVVMSLVILLIFFCIQLVLYQVDVLGRKKNMRQKFLREFKKELIKSNYFWSDDIRDVIHIANRTYKKCTKEFKEFKRKRNEKYFKQDRLDMD